MIQVKGQSTFHERYALQAPQKLSLNSIYCKIKSLYRWFLCELDFFFISIDILCAFWAELYFDTNEKFFIVSANYHIASEFFSSFDLLWGFNGLSKSFLPLPCFFFCSCLQKVRQLEVSCVVFFLFISKLGSYKMK